MYVAQSKFKSDLKQSKKKLNVIWKDIDKLKEIFSFKQEHKDVKETPDIKEYMIAVLWNSSESSYKFE